MKVFRVYVVIKGSLVHGLGTIDGEHSLKYKLSGKTSSAKNLSEEANMLDPEDILYVTTKFISLPL